MRDNFAPRRHILRQVRNSDADKLHRTCHVRTVLDPLKPLSIQKQHFGFGVFQGVGHLLGRPPRIHADNRNADRDAGPVDEQPLRIVPHGDGNPVARLDTLVKQPGRDRVYAVMGFGIGEALTFVDEVSPVREFLRRLPDLANAGRSILVDAKRVAEDFSFDNFEVTARSGQFLARLQKFCVVHVSPQ